MFSILENKMHNSRRNWKGWEWSRAVLVLVRDLLQLSLGLKFRMRACMMDGMVEVRAVPLATVRSAGRAAGIPNGTGVPGGTPPGDEPPEPSPPILPPVPPFPTLGDDMASGMLDRYEVMHDGPKIRMGDGPWKTEGASSHEPRPGEARAFWLEREVVALKHSWEKTPNWNPFKSSECWSNGFQSSLVFLPEARTLTSLWTLDVRILIWPSASAGSILVTFLGTRSVEVALILAEIGLAVLACVVLKTYVTCVVEAVFNLAKVGLAWGRIATIKNVMVTCLVEVDLNPLKLGLCSAITVNILTIGLCMTIIVFVLTLGLRIALMVFVMVIGLPLHRIHIMEIHDALVSNQAWWRWVPASWESGGGIGGCKADLPELPSTASPLQFGDWIHLCGPVMRDLSSVASRWWDLKRRYIGYR